MTSYMAGDVRRAGAGIRWHGENNSEGVIAVIEEAIEAKRVTQFLQSVCLLYGGLMEALMTKAGMLSIATEIAAWAKHHPDPDTRRAALFACCHSINDIDGMNKVLREANAEERTVQLLFSALDFHALLVPAANTRFGLDRMQHLVTRLAMRENGLDPDTLGEGS